MRLVAVCLLLAVALSSPQAPPQECSVCTSARVVFQLTAPATGQATDRFQGKSNISSGACANTATSNEDSFYLCSSISGQVYLRNVALGPHAQSILYYTDDARLQSRALPPIKSTRYRKNSFVQIPLVAEPSSKARCKTIYQGTLHVIGANTVHNHFHAIHDNILPFYAQLALDSITDPSFLLKPRAVLVGLQGGSRETVRAPVLQLLDTSFDDVFKAEQAAGMCFERIIWNSGPRLFYHHPFVKLRRVATDLLRSSAAKFWNLTSDDPFSPIAPTVAQPPGLLLNHLGLPLRIVIFSRGATSSGRSITNEAALVDFFLKRGAKAVLFDEYTESSIRRQVSLSFHADMIIGVHGAALANAIFMKSGGYLLELKTAYGFSLDLFALVADARFYCSVYIVFVRLRRDFA